MSKPETPSSSPKGDDRNVAVAEKILVQHDFEERVRQFWAKNRVILIGIAVVVVGLILGREGMKMVEAKRLEATQADFAAASTDSELQIFATDNAGHPLAGAAHLQVADNAFDAGRYAEAIEAYDAAAVELGDTIFGSRIRLGRAMAVLRNGDEAGGRQALQELANDTDATSAARGEAAYHLAAMATAEGNAARVTELVNQITEINPASTWAQRAMILQASVVDGDS